MSFYVDDIRIGTHWKRKKTGVIYKVTDVNGQGNACLTPVYVPPGKRARETWKWVTHIPFDLEQVEKPEATP